MIVYDLHVGGVSVLPSEADSPLSIDTDAILTGAVAAQSFKPAAGRNAQIAEFLRAVEQKQFAPCDSREPTKPGNAFVTKEPFGVAVMEAPDRKIILFCNAEYRKRNGSGPT